MTEVAKIRHFQYIRCDLSHGVKIDVPSRKFFKTQMIFKFNRDSATGKPIILLEDHVGVAVKYLFPHIRMA